MVVESNTDYGGGTLRSYYVSKSILVKARIGKLLFLKGKKRIGLIKTKQNSPIYISATNNWLNLGNVALHERYCDTIKGSVECKKLKNQLLQYPKVRTSEYMRAKKAGSGNDDIAIGFLMMFYIYTTLLEGDSGYTIVK